MSQFTVNRSDLLKLLGKLQPVAKARTLMPVLDHYLIKTDKDKGEVTVTASNLEVFLSGRVKVDVTEEGAVLVPLSIVDFLKATKAEQVTLHGIQADKSVKVEANGASKTLPSWDPEDFPPIPVAGGKKVEISNLADSLKQVSHSIATEDSRPVLACVCLTSKKGSVELAAADGFRLAITDASAKGKLAEQALIPLGAVRLIEKLYPSEVTMQVSPKSKSLGSHQWATFEGNGLTLTATVTQGSYPNYPQLIPTQEGHCLTVATKDLKEAVMMASITAKKGSGITRLVTTEKGLLVTSTDADEVTETLVPVRSGQIQIAFDWRYLMDILNRAGEEFTIRTTTPSSPGLIKVNGTIHVVMPMFVQW